MLHARTCTAVCWRDGGSWVVHLPELGRTAQASRLSQVEGVARSLVAVFTSDDPATYRVVVDLRVQHGVTELVEAAAALREQRDRVSVEAVTMRRGLARRLAAEGFDVRDVAALLGLSYGRALQLVGEHGHGMRSAHLPTPERSADHRPPAQRQPGPPPQPTATSCPTRTWTRGTA